jgi:hypothetical protein
MDIAATAPARRRSDVTAVCARLFERWLVTELDDQPDFEAVTLDRS